MIYHIVSTAAIWLWVGSQARVIPRQAGGSGPYAAAYTTDAGLPGQTIFLPTTIPASLKIPVVVWGVGGCMQPGNGLAQFHEDIASQGVMVIVNNGPTTQATTNATSLTAAADWVQKVAGTGKYANVDKSRIAVSGWSCGGLEAYAVVNDPRWVSIGIFSSGELDATQSAATVAKITKPIFYFLGGTNDPAQTPGTRDYSNLPKTTPAWIGTDNMGHGHDSTAGAFTAPSIVAAAIHWAQWILRGNATAGTFFKDSAEATSAGWTSISAQNLDQISVTAI